MVKTRINITIERKLLKELDDYLKSRKAGLSRSSFLELAAEHVLKEVREEKRDLAIVKA
jgi:metal-responsive CopG/Arc/MetJ family transcriptional regulator